MASKDEKKDKKESTAAEKSDPKKTEPSKEMRMLYRPKDDKVIAGVVSGIARYVGIDVSIARILAFLLFLMNPPQFILIYIIAAIVIPEKDIKADEKDGHDSARMLGWVLVAGGAYLLIVRVLRFTIPSDMAWGLALIALGAYLLRRR